MPLRSRRAIAGISRSAACCIRNSGRDAPSRKLKAERAWSSTYSVIGPLHIPAPRARIECDAADTFYAVGSQPDIPLFPAPVRFRPPLPADTPRTGYLTHDIPLALPEDSRGRSPTEYNPD